MKQTFYFCYGLTEDTVYNIPEGVTNMDQTFYYCNKLTGTVTIPSTVTSMTNCFGSTKLPITMKYYSNCTAASNYSAPSNVTKEVITG